MTRSLDDTSLERTLSLELSRPLRGASLLSFCRNAGNHDENWQTLVLRAAGYPQLLFSASVVQLPHRSQSRVALRTRSRRISMSLPPLAPHRELSDRGSSDGRGSRRTNTARRILQEGPKRS